MRVGLILFLFFLVSTVGCVNQPNTGSPPTQTAGDANQTPDFNYSELIAQKSEPTVPVLSIMGLSGVTGAIAIDTVFHIDWESESYSRNIQKENPNGTFLFRAYHQDSGESRLLYQFRFFPSYPSEGPPILAIVSLIVPDLVGPKRLSVDHFEILSATDHSMLASRTRSAHAPVVRIVSPEAGSTIEKTTVMKWEASDEDNDPLKFTLRYSWDNEKSYSPLVVNDPQTTYSFDYAFDQLPGSQPGKGILELTVNDGFNDTRIKLENLSVGARKPPKVYISLPNANWNPTRENANLIFDVSAQDPEDGPISPSQIIWKSDLDGELGTQEQLGRGYSSLSVGKHVLTATATDSDGMSASDTVELEIIRR